MSQVTRAAHYDNTTRADAVAARQHAYAHYVAETTPKRLPALDAGAGYAPREHARNYTYTDAQASPRSSDSESPVKKQRPSHTPNDVSPVKLPSFKSLLQSIHPDAAAPASSSAGGIDTPLMSSLHLESASVQSSPAVDRDNATCFGGYSYSKPQQYDDPYAWERCAQWRQPLGSLSLQPGSQLLAPAVVRQDTRSQQQSPLQQDHFAAFVPQSRFVFPQQQVQQQVQHQHQVQQISGLRQLAQAIRSNELLRLKSPEKRFRCKVCARGFNTAGNLSRHKKVHTGEKKYKCQYPGCESKFARSDSCMQHYRTHANENGYTSRRFKRLRSDDKSDNEADEEEDEAQADGQGPAKQARMKLGSLVC